jgi:hypothetical protein
MKIRYLILLLSLVGLLWLGQGSALTQEPTTPPQEGVEPLPQGPVHEAFAKPAINNVEAPEIVPKDPPAPVNETPPDQKPEGSIHRLRRPRSTRVRPRRPPTRRALTYLAAGSFRNNSSSGVPATGASSGPVGSGRHATTSRRRAAACSSAATGTIRWSSAVCSLLPAASIRGC